MTSTPSDGSLKGWLAADPKGARRAIDAAICRRSLAEFIRRGWHVLEPSTPLTWNWHIDAIAGHIQAALEGWVRKQADPSFVQPIQNLLVNVPPGTAKSRIVGVYTPAWMWLHRPAWRAIFLSSNPRVALRDSLYTRDLVESAWYRDTFRPAWTLSADRNAKGLFGNTAGGTRQAMGFGARITGDRGDAIFWDDPHDAEEVLSEAIRRGVTDRWDSAMSNRVNDLRSSLRFGIMQRLHDEDLSGHVLKQGGWEHLCLPQEFDATVARASAIGWRDPRAEDGELLFPARFTREIVEAEKRRLGPYGYAGQHQQRPAPREGGMLQPQWFKPVDAPPSRFESVLRYWDTAGAKPGKGDWTVGLLMGKCHDGLFWVLDVVRGQWPADERNAVILQTAGLDRQKYPSARIAVEQPPGLAKESTDAIVRMLAGFAVEPDPVHRDKESRAEPLSAQARAGNVRMVRAAWNAPYLACLAAFPFGAHDDDVDATSGAFNKLSARRRITVL